MTDARPVASLRDVGLRYGATHALEAVGLHVRPECMVGLIGPDGVGKSSVLALIAGARRIQTGTVHVLGGDMPVGSTAGPSAQASPTCRRASARIFTRRCRSPRTSTSSAGSSGTIVPRFVSRAKG